VVDTGPVAGSWRSAGDLPLKVASGAGRVRVELLDRAKSVRAGVSGVLVRVDRPATVRMDYSGFRSAYGGDYAARLGFVKLPDCVLSTPGAAACRRGSPVATGNDTRAATAAATLATGGVYALAAASSGPAGSFRASSLAASATWQVGLQSGDFNWSYPLGVPPAAGGAPRLSLSYSSAGIDGHAAATNNQPSWIGDGFDLPVGFIERSYRSCADDGRAGSAELCWNSANGKPQQTVTVPVVGNDAGKPCHGSTFDTSWCQQAWRWQLSAMVDTHGNTTSFFYETESNFYSRASYIRSGQVKRIEYGQRDGQVYASTPTSANPTF
jgi:hypothetical protein